MEVSASIRAYIDMLVDCYSNCDNLAPASRPPALEESAWLLLSSYLDDLTSLTALYWLRDQFARAAAYCCKVQPAGAGWAG